MTDILLHFVISACLGVLVFWQPEGVARWIVVLASWLSGVMFTIGVVKFMMRRIWNEILEEAAQTDGGAPGNWEP